MRANLGGHHETSVGEGMSPGVVGPGSASETVGMDICWEESIIATLGLECLGDIEDGCLILIGEGMNKDGNDRGTNIHVAETITEICVNVHVVASHHKEAKRIEVGTSNAGVDTAVPEVVGTGKDVGALVYLSAGECTLKVKYEMSQTVIGDVC